MPRPMPEPAPVMITLRGVVDSKVGPFVSGLMVFFMTACAERPPARDRTGPAVRRSGAHAEQHCPDSLLGDHTVLVHDLNPGPYHAAVGLGHRGLDLDDLLTDVDGVTDE